MRKSRIDRIYINFSHSKLRGYSSYVSISDDYLIGMFEISDQQMGLNLWQFPSDLLLSEAFVQQVNLVLENFNKKDPLAS